MNTVYEMSLCLFFYHVELGYLQQCEMRIRPTSAPQLRCSHLQCNIRDPVSYPFSCDLVPLCTLDEHGLNRPCSFMRRPGGRGVARWSLGAVGCCM